MGLLMMHNIPYSIHFFHNIYFIEKTTYLCKLNHKIKLFFVFVLILPMVNHSYQQIMFSKYIAQKRKT